MVTVDRASSSLVTDETVVMAALCNTAGHYIFALRFLMVALWNKADHYIFILWFLLSSFFRFFLA